jgi:two-component system sensor histidine kinase RpfC
MDVNMPVLNGIEAAKLARFIELDGPRVSIVALTADATAETRARCLEAGMDDCLTKPIDQAKLLAWLEHFQKSRFDTDRKASPISKQECASSPADACESTESSLALDYRALEDLESLGGKEFVDQIVSQFVEDATSVLKDLSEAVAKGDAYTFR